MNIKASSNNGDIKMTKLTSRYDISTNTWLVGYWKGRSFVVVSKVAA